MRKSRFSDQQIALALQQAERRLEIRSLQSKLSVSERRALRVTGWPGSTHRHKSRAADQKNSHWRALATATAG
jgi:hypothetical protein